MNASPEPSQRAGLAMWLAGARPRTLVAAIVPVAVGAAVAVGHSNDTRWWRAAAALAVALALQVGVNFANDYSDGIRGTDGSSRTGPVRLVGSGSVSPALVKRAALGAFAAAGLFGLLLALVVGPELLVVGVLCVVAAWTYTGGSRPYGYRGLGEVSVFVFFGLVATMGTNYVLTDDIDGLAAGCAVVIGLWATGLLVINNLRDIPGDRDCGKITLAVRLGDARTRHLFTAMQAAAMLIAVLITVLTGRFAAAALVGLPFAVHAVGSVRRKASGSELIAVLAATGRVQLIAGLAMALGIALTG
ncbi:MAG: 1,4-dihydroxy-2-naphthoate polyprenyltransferase [Acidimicrobiaceae bacterium]|nr:1,4-dihydroxy-2-naphthoate polyprenyltransferase [Acidimicrobiaceae bacterium]